MAKFQNKYRSESARAQWWDYGWNGAYLPAGKAGFITICTKNREHFFGEIRNGKMELLPLGAIVDILWHEIPNHASFVELGDFVVMPNHIHGILIIDKPNRVNENGTNVGMVAGTGHALSQQTSVQPSHQTPDQTPIAPTIGQNRFQNIGKNTVSSIIGFYKSAVTKHANRLGFENGWQSRFHDHIIRNDMEYQRISDYINNNPTNWSDDKFYLE